MRLTRANRRERGLKARLGEVETALYESKENLLREAKDRQKSQAGLRAKALVLEKAKMQQTDVA